MEKEKLKEELKKELCLCTKETCNPFFPDTCGWCRRIEEKTKIELIYLKFKLKLFHFLYRFFRKELECYVYFLKGFLIGTLVVIGIVFIFK